MKSIRPHCLLRLRIFKTSVLVALALSFPSAIAAQQPDDTLVTNTSLVQLNVGVVDRQGHAITSLSQNDFAIYEDGVRRPISVFESAETPFSLVMLLDTSGSTLPFRQQIEQAALRFLDALAPGDRVAVVEFNGKGVKSELGFTSELRRVAYAISYTLGAKGRGDTPLYDALEFSVKELQKEGKRRKAIVVLTDGIDTQARNADRSALAKVADSELATTLKAESYSRVTSVLNQADRSGVTIFPLALPSGDPKRLPMPDATITAMYVAAHERLDLLANRTGGRLHEVKRLDELAKIYPEIAAEMRSLYTIAYQPPNQNVHDGAWRAIRIEVTNPDLVARTKPGYYAR